MSKSGKKHLYDNVYGNAANARVAKVGVAFEDQGLSEADYEGASAHDDDEEVY